MTPGTMQDGLLIFTVPTLLHLTSRQRPKTFVDSKLIHLFFSLAVNSKLYNIRPRIQFSACAKEAAARSYKISSFSW